MKAVITGGAGFLGSRLVAALLARGSLRGDGDRQEAIERIVILDAARTATAPIDRRVSAVTGDITDPDLFRDLLSPDTSIFHLAAVVSGGAEADFELGMRVNVDATRRLLDACRAAVSEGECRFVPRLVFTSSIAVYGGELPAVVPESTAVTPRSSYGMQKAVAELLINEYTRRGFVDGRVLRLPTISVRPGLPNAAASSFASGIIREPLNGVEAVCPVDPDTRLWLASPATAIDCVIAGHDVPSKALGANRIVNVPGLSVTVAEMVATLSRLAGPEVAGRVRWHRDPAVAGIVATWPAALDVTRALALGFPRDESFDAIVRRFMSDELGATSSR
jgi:nucleoside-diphosphate-sugar epimerase